MKKFSDDLKYLIPLWGVLFLVFLMVFAHQGNLILDCGREVFYPKRILEGSILYHDLFNIYAPFAYLFNAFLYKIFGINLNTLYISGMFTATGIITLLYLISRLFFDKFLSFAISLCSIATGVFSLNLFNFVFPYSYSLTYGLFAFLISLYLLILSVKNKNNKLYYLSVFFASIAVFCKYEFLAYILIFIFTEYKLKLNIKRIFLSILIFLSVPAILFGFLFHQGLSITDLLQNLKDIIKMSQTQTFRYFYAISGLSPQKQTLGLLIRTFLKTLSPLILLYFGTSFYNKSKIKAVLLFAFSLWLTAIFTGLETFIFLSVLLFILIILFIKNQPLEVQILSLSAFLVSLKVFFVVALNSYGTFFIGILLIAVLCFVKPVFRKQIGIYLIILSCFFSINSIKNRKFLTTKIQTNNGTIFIDIGYKDTINKFIDYIEKNTKKSDKILIIPEGLFLNFLTDRRSDDFYNSLLPLYVETFGEKRLINHFEKNKPDYIVIHNYPTSDYYFKSICKDYGFEFCKFMQTNYRVNHFIDGNFRLYILKLQNKG